MSASAFREGAEVEIEGRAFTLVRLVEPDLWQVEAVRTKRIEELPTLHLQTLYVEGKLTFASRCMPARASDESPRVVAFSPEQWEAARVRRSYVMATLDIPNTPSRIEPVIESTWRTLQKPARAPDRVTIFRWKRRFLKAGKDITSLMDMNDRKGNTTPRYPREVEEFARQAIDKKYLTQERGTIEDALNEALNLVRIENALRPDAMQLPRPTRRLIKRLIHEIPAFDRDAARYGRTSAVKKYRACLQHRTTSAPLERAEIDHTLLDLMVVDDVSGLPLGRPWMTVCLDDYSRCVLGIHIGFEPPSHFTVGRCLKHALLPKVGMDRYFPALKNKWEAHGVMRELVVDNGLEFHSASLENACYTLGIEIHFSARKTPWFKGKIERFLGTLNRAVAHGTPGTTFHSIFEKDEYDPSKHAVVRYNVLKEVIFTWISDVYHQQVHRTIGVPPSTMWKGAIRPDEISLPDDPARLDAILGRSEKRKLTHKGVELNGLLYNSPELTNIRRTFGDKLDVDVRVDAENLGQIVVFSPDMRQMFKVPALRSEYAAGLSEYQHRICKRYAARELDQSSVDAWLEAKSRIADLIDSELMQKRQRTRTRIARYKGEVGLSEQTAGTTRPTVHAQVRLAASSETAKVDPLPVEPSATGVPRVAGRRKFAPLYRPRNSDAEEPDGESSHG